MVATGPVEGDVCEVTGVYQYDFSAAPHNDSDRDLAIRSWFKRERQSLTVTRAIEDNRTMRKVRLRMIGIEWT